MKNKLLSCNTGCIFLFALGLFQIFGDILGLKALKGMGAATLLSPLPKVFSDVDGLETFASEFKLELFRSDGSSSTVNIDPQRYALVRGPYKRRNVYGAAISYLPRLSSSLWHPVLHYGLCNGSLAKELELESDFTKVKVHIRTKTSGRSDSWTETLSCVEKTN